MRWSQGCGLFPNQWLELIPTDACEKYGKQYVDEVAIVRLIREEPTTDDVVIKGGYVQFVYYTFGATSRV